MSDCQNCPIERLCYYPYKPCDCFDQRKFWDEQRRMAWDVSRGNESRSRSEFGAVLFQHEENT